MRKLSEELPPRGHGGEGQVTVMAQKMVKINHIFFSGELHVLGISL